jgi:nucleoid-associated protein YgaU
LLALVFQRPAPPPGPVSDAAGARSVWNDMAEMPPQEPKSRPLPVVRLQASPPQPTRPDSGQNVAPEIAPLDRGEPPPPLARSFPGDDSTVASRWGAMLGLTPVTRARPDAATRRHRVADGDTLRRLAQRYLGSADRFTEIYEANRQLLPNPEVLPIGVELSIPPRQQESPPARGSDTGKDDRGEAKGLETAKATPGNRAD